MKIVEAIFWIVIVFLVLIGLAMAASIIGAYLSGLL